jgi:hypothetical protein
MLWKQIFVFLVNVILNDRLDWLIVLLLRELIFNLWIKFIFLVKSYKIKPLELI